MAAPAVQPAPVAPPALVRVERALPFAVNILEEHKETKGLPNYYIIRVNFNRGQTDVDDENTMKFYVEAKTAAIALSRLELIYNQYELNKQANFVDFREKSARGELILYFSSEEKNAEKNGTKVYMYTLVDQKLTQLNDHKKPTIVFDEKIRLLKGFGEELLIRARARARERPEDLGDIPVGDIPDLELDPEPEHPFDAID